MQLSLVLLDTKSKFLEGNHLSVSTALENKFKDELSLFHVICED